VVATNSALYEHMNDDMDINAARIGGGAATVEEIGADIYDIILSVASGQETESESSTMARRSSSPGTSASDVDTASHETA
jgi:altronate hydrolase